MHTMYEHPWHRQQIETGPFCVWGPSPPSSPWPQRKVGVPKRHGGIYEGKFESCETQGNMNKHSQ